MQLVAPITFWVPPVILDHLPRMSLDGRLRPFISRYVYTAPRVFFALTLGLATQRHRKLLWHLGQELGFTEEPLSLPSVTPESLVDERQPVVLREMREADGNVTARELVFLAQLVRTRSPRRIFEIGTFDGRTTLALAANSPDDSHVFTLDLPAGDPSALRLAHGERAFVDKPASGERVRRSEYAQKVKLLLGDSATFDFGPYPSDLVFVDGSHAYEYVLRDSHSARAMIGSGPGMIVWHDYGTWSGVTNALNELQRDHRAFAGVVRVHGTSFAVLVV